MTPTLRSCAPLAAVAAVAVLTACGGSPKATGTSPATSQATAASSTTSSASASTTTTSTPSARTATSTTASQPSASASARPALVHRTAAQLKKALLELSDAPSGFAVEPPSKDPGVKMASTNPRCAPFVKLSNAATAPGSTATADVSLSGGQSGPFIDESIDALGSAAPVAALQARFKAAIAACGKVAVSIPGAGTSTVTVRPVKPPRYGQKPLSARMTATSGPLAGTEITLVTTGVGDTVLSLTFVGALPDDIDAAASVAVEKATEVLRTRAAS